MKTLVAISCWLLICFLTGCQQPTGDHSQKNQLNTLKQHNASLKAELNQTKTTNQQLKDQIATLRGLKNAGKLAALATIESINISRYTNLYDKDKDGIKEMLIVYLQPVDEDGDIVKAPGSVEVQLWNLDKPQNKALLASWQVSAEELKQLWLSSFMEVNYRLAFVTDPQITKSKGSLIVKVTFTDYLTGKVFKQQRIIKP